MDSPSCSCKLTRVSGAPKAPIHWAASRGHVAAVEALAKGGADLDIIEGKYGSVPLFMAVSGHRLFGGHRCLNALPVEGTFEATAY